MSQLSSMEMVWSRELVVFVSGVVFHARIPYGRSLFMFSNSRRLFSFLTIQISNRSPINILNNSRCLIYFGSNVLFLWMPYYRVAIWHAARVPIATPV